MDGGLAGDEWKRYAAESDQVWYVGGTNADDQIDVNFVTEPGLLTDHHLITRLTNNNGNFSFAAQIRLDFDATDGDGNPVWDENRLKFKTDELFANADAVAREQQLTKIATQTSTLEDELLLASIIPPEGDFQVILIDAMGGNDVVTVGPTVQKSVWVDGGAGDDRIEILSGNAILVDKTERSGGAGFKGRNDLPAQAYPLLSSVDGTLQALDGTAINSDGIEFNGLTMDNASDVDYYSFKHVKRQDYARFTSDFQVGTPKAGWQYMWNAPTGWTAGGASGNGTTGAIGNPVNYRPMIWNGTFYTPDGDTNNSNNQPAGFAQVGPTASHPGLGSTQTGSVGNTQDRYVIYAYTITQAGSYRIDDSTITRGVAPNNLRVMVHVNANAPVFNSVVNASNMSFNTALGNLNPGDVVYVAVGPEGSDGSDTFSLDFAISPVNVPAIQLASGSPIDALGLAIFEQGTDVNNPANRINASKYVSSGNSASISLAGLDPSKNYWLQVTSPNLVPTPYSLRLNYSGTASTAALQAMPKVFLGIRSDSATRRDVILGGTGDDILRGGAGEDWIFGNDGNDVLVGGFDRQASDLLFGGNGNDTFQIIPDALPLLGNQPNTEFDPATKLMLPTYSDQFIGGAGTDRVLYLGGDKDRRGFDVPDYAAIQYDTTWHRYEFTSLVWDIGTQTYRTTTDLNGQHSFQREFAFYQTRDVEQTQIETRSGNDVVRGDRGFQFAVSSLAHRYSFNEAGGTTFVDSVGGPAFNARIVNESGSGTTSGQGGHQVANGQARLFGGVNASSDYIELPDNLLTGLTDATFEFWATPRSIQNWSRIFDFGLNTTDYFTSTWTQGTIAGTDRVEWIDTGVTGDNNNQADNTLSPLSLNTEVHLAYVVDEGAGPGGKTLVTWYKNGSFAGSFDTDAKLKDLTPDNNWLGRSKYPDNTADASFNEFRVYSKALTENEIKSSRVAGPNAVIGGAFAALPATNEQEYGIDRGDFEQGASEAQLIIGGGDGNDFLFGGEIDDTIRGGAGNDYIQGGLGNDRLDGDGGLDQIHGLRPSTVTVSAYPYAPPQPPTSSSSTFRPSDINTIWLLPIC